MGKTKNKTYWNVPVPKTLDEALRVAIRMDMHVSKADFIRDAVRRLLEQLGLYPLTKEKGKILVEAKDEGVTELALDFYRKNKRWLGKLLSVRGIAWDTKTGRPSFFLEFENAVVHFTGLNCGYYGEGPTGLARILFEEGFFKSFSEAREFVASREKIDLRREEVEEVGSSK